MDEDNTSPVVDDSTETPADDPILSLLSDTEDAPEADTTPVEEAEAVEETPSDEEAEAETPPEGEPTEDEVEEAQPELDPKEEARRRYEERQQAIAERRDKIAEQNNEYVNAAEDEYDQRLRNMEVKQYADLIENNENKLIGEFERVKANPDLQMFNPDNKETFSQKAYDKALRDYNAGYVEYDANGNMVGIKGSLFEHLTETAELFGDAVKTGAVQQARATKQMRSNADAKPAATPKTAPKDDILDILKSD